MAQLEVLKTVTGSPNLTFAVKSDPSICEPGGKGFIFPLLSSEQFWPTELRATLYIAALCWIFVGVAIIADKFVASIEEVTQKKLRIKTKTGGYKTYKVWNDTVANLTLMALGSSAPEILLSIIETVKNGFHSGKLGPSTIVGSAAFNLFIIIAVCIVSIPNGEVRTIKERGVFYVTAVFSVVAYLWLVFIVSLVSPDVVELWEALITLLMMPVLVYVSYLTDIGYFDKCTKKKCPTESTRVIQGNAIGNGYTPTLQKAHSWSEGLKPAQLLHLASDVIKPDASFGFDMITFESDTMEVTGTSKEHVLYIPVYRRNGNQEEASCKYRTEKLSAQPAYDYIHEEGDLVFAPGTNTAHIPITILPKKLMEHSDRFQIILEDAEGPACFNPNDDGGKLQGLLTVTIQNETDSLTRRHLAARAITAVDGAMNMDSLRHSTITWWGEIKDSLALVGEDDDGESVAPGCADYIMFLIAAPWKFVFSVLVPPPPYCGGWICFVVSLGFIGFLTSVVCDFAELLGCVLTLDESIVAITFVALGTSMPDLFASKTAAVQDEHADASIVNVTGSNCVNVFLGIGLPWTMSSVYWKVVGATPSWKLRYPSIAEEYTSGVFVVQGGDLGFSVVVFSVGAVVALAVIQLRRTKYGGELGGPPVVKLLSSILLALLWVFYVVLSIWKTLNPAASGEDQVWMVIKGMFILQIVALIVGFVATRFQKKGQDDEKDIELGRSPALPPPCGTVAVPARGRGRRRFRKAVFASLAIIKLKRAVRVRNLTPRWGQPKRLDWDAPVQSFEPPSRMRDGVFVKQNDLSHPAAPLGTDPAVGDSISADDAILRTITVAAMTSWAAVKMKRNAGIDGQSALSRQATNMSFHDAESPREIERIPSFHSASASVQPDPTVPTMSRRESLAAAGKNLADWASNHAADWVTLSVAGWLAAQAAQAADPASQHARAQ